MLESGLLGLLASLDSKLAEDEKKEAREFIDAGEYGLAFETVCVCLHEKDTAVSSSEYSEIQRLGRLMELQDVTWSGIRVHT
jgi:hypothetical protein